MGKTIRIQGMILAVALLGASGMNASAHSGDAGDAGMEVSGETSPIVPETVSDADRALRLNPSDTTNALHITLPPAHAPQQSSQPSRPLQVGFHRTMPDEYQDDLAPQLDWIPLDDGTIASTMSVTSPEATNMRMGILVDLPPGGEIRFFGVDTQQRSSIITREDINWKGDKPQTRWSPVVEGDTIGVEIVLPSEEVLSSFSFTIDRISHGYGTDGGFGYTPQILGCSNHIDVQCRVASVSRGLENAVGRIRFETPAGAYVCSGTLMTDRDPSVFVPYFLTAHHCIANAGVAESVTTLWFYKRAACGGSGIDSRYTVTNIGTNLLTTSAAQDSTLLRYKTLLPTGLPYAYSGWSNRSIPNSTAVYGLHHPDGGVMKYSAGRKIGTARYRLSGTNINVNNAYEVDWSQGTTEPGSSGSGLFLPGNAGHFIGVNSASDGGSCSTKHTFYGSFRDFYPQVSRWLNATTAPGVPPPFQTDDHGNTPGTATLVSIPSTTRGNLERGGDLDYFRINVRRAGQLRAYTTGSTDTFGTLFRDGRRIASNDDGGSGNNFQFTANVQTGTYYIEVRSYSGTATGAYSLRVEGPAARPPMVHTLPFVTPASNRTQRSLVRIINRSDRSGRVTIHTIDDTGERFGPVSLWLMAGETRHIDSPQLESGRTLSGGIGVGNGEGDWRLELSTTLDITTLAYVRGASGFITTMHDVVRDAAMRQHVASFNKAPVSHGWSRSELRLINPNNNPVNITITAHDDRGDPAAGTVRLSLPAGAARRLNSHQLERGGSGFDGRFGSDGYGRWQVFVSATRPIWVMNLMRSPDTGYMTNLSSEREEP